MYKDDEGEGSRDENEENSKKKLDVEEEGDGLESVDLADRGTAQCSVLRPNKGSPSFIHDLWQIRCNYHIKGSVWKKKKRKKKKKKPVSMALHYGGERRTKRNSARFTREEEEEEGRWRWRAR